MTGLPSVVEAQQDGPALVLLLDVRVQRVRRLRVLGVVLFQDDVDHAEPAVQLRTLDEVAAQADAVDVAPDRVADGGRQAVNEAAHLVPAQAAGGVALEVIQQLGLAHGARADQRLAGVRAGQPDGVLEGLDVELAHAGRR